MIYNLAVSLQAFLNKVFAHPFAAPLITLGIGLWVGYNIATHTSSDLLNIVINGVGLVLSSVAASASYLSLQASKKSHGEIGEAHERLQLMHHHIRQVNEQVRDIRRVVKGKE